MNSTEDPRPKSNADRPAKPREGLASIDDAIDAIARKALESARCLEEAERRKSKQPR